MRCARTGTASSFTSSGVTIESNDASWEVHYKKETNSVKFIAFSMDKVAEENTALFNFTAGLRENISDKEVKVLLSDIGTANGSDSLKVSDVQFNYVASKEELKEEVPSIGDFSSHKVEDVENDIDKDVNKEKEDQSKDNKLLLILGVVLVLIVVIVFVLVLLKKGYFNRKK